MPARHTYATEIDTARKCWRKWWFKYMGPKQAWEESVNQVLGQELHDLSERWNKLAQAPVPGRSVADDIMVVALPWLPAPRTGASEGDARIEIPDGHGQPLRYGTKTDWTGLSSELPKFAEMDLFGVVPAVEDLKTSSDPLKYGNWTREKFLDDTQAVLYLLKQALAMSSDVVGGRWLYLKTPKKNPDGSFKLGAKVEAFPSDVVLGRDALNRAHLRVVAPFKRGIDDIRAATSEGRGPHPLSLPYDMEFCFEYRKPCEALEPMCKGHFDPAALVSAGYSGAVKGVNEMGFLDATANGHMPPPLNGHAPQQGFQPPPTQGYAPPPANQQQAPMAPQGNPYNGQQAPQYAPPPAQAAQQQAPQYTPGVNPPEAHAAYGTAQMPGYPGAQQQAPTYQPPAPSFAQQAAPAPQQAPATIPGKPTDAEVVAALRTLIRLLSA